MITDFTTYNRNYYHKRREAIITYLGGKCVACGTTNELEVDHIDPALKSFNISKRCSLTQIKAELAKCQLLCKTHHREKTASEKLPFSHGTVYGWMKKKCECNRCTKARLQFNAERRLKRGAPIRGHYNKPGVVQRQETTDSKSVQC